MNFVIGASSTEDRGYARSKSFLASLSESRLRDYDGGGRFCTMASGDWSIVIDNYLGQPQSLRQVRHGPQASSLEATPFSSHVHLVINGAPTCTPNTAKSKCREKQIERTSQMEDVDGSCVLCHFRMCRLAHHRGWERNAVSEHERSATLTSGFRLVKVGRGVGK